MNIIVWYLCTSWLTNYEYLWFFWSLDSSLAGRFQVWVSFLVEVSFLFVLEKEFSESLLLRNKPSYLCKIQTTLNVCTADLCKVQALWERRSAIERRYKYHQQNVVVQWLVHLRRVNTQFVGLKFTGYGQIHTRTSLHLGRSNSKWIMCFIVFSSDGIKNSQEAHRNVSI